MDMQEKILQELITIRKILMLKITTMFYCEVCEDLIPYTRVKDLEDLEKFHCPDCENEVKI